jgi:glutathione S-transferase
VPRGTAGWVALEEMLPVLLARLQAAPYFLGESFSALDVLYGSSFALFARSELFPRSALLEAYVQRLVSRPAFARGMARDAAHS